MDIHELDQLGDEIAELSAHLDAATAHLLDLIREFDARGGWNSGFRSCAAWLSWRVGLDRHENIGKGRLGLTPFRLLLRDRRLAHIPKVIETPKEPAPAADIKNLAVLRALRAGARRR